MTAPELTAAEAARVAAIEAAPAAEEALVERMARALWEVANPAMALVLTVEMRDKMWNETQLSPLRSEYRVQALAALAVVRGES